MYQGKLRKFTLILLAVYIVVILYFLYIGFHRINFVQNSNLRYDLIPGGIPLHFPMGRDFRNWFFEWGNFAAFIPFGLMIPLLFRCNFIRFILIFILSITILETLQMLSRLGAFDIDDIIINTLGAAVGYGSQQLVTQSRDQLKGISRIILTAIVFSSATFGIVGGINHYLEKVDGRVIALNESPLKNGSVLWDEKLSSFEVAQTKVKPLINLYSRKNAKTNEFTYLLNGKYKQISGYYAIPDDLFNRASNGKSNIIFSADGRQVYSIGISGENELFTFEVDLKGVNELSIKIIDDDPDSNKNPIMWDTTLTEVNTGQEIINSIKEKLGWIF